jgi:hypothetical protein
MDKYELLNRLNEATQVVLAFTEKYTTNTYSDNFKYLIVPNDRASSEHLNDRELELLQVINDLENKELSIDQCIDILWDDNKVPLWINMDVFESNLTSTVIMLTTSRRFRNDEDLSKNQYAPFHLGVPIPPNHELSENNKFDINWRRKLSRGGA